MVVVKLDNEFIIDYTIIEFRSGIKQVLINTKNRWINFDIKNDYMIDFYKENEDEFAHDHNTDYRLEISKEFLDIENRSYIRTQLQEKDQLSIYYIPRELLSRNRKLENNKDNLIFILKSIDNRIVDVKIAKDEKQINLLEKAGYILDINNEASKLQLICL